MPAFSSSWPVVLENEKLAAKFDTKTRKFSLCWFCWVTAFPGNWSSETMKAMFSCWHNHKSNFFSRLAFYWDVLRRCFDSWAVPLPHPTTNLFRLCAIRRRNVVAVYSDIHSFEIWKHINCDEYHNRFISTKYVNNCH